jgi:MFS family permease
LSQRIFYGWWMVAACLAVATVAWALGLFGISVFLHALARDKGWSIGLISSAITVYYMIAAVLVLWVGNAIDRWGPKPVISLGVVCMASGVAFLGQVTETWQPYVAFFVMGIGWSCLSTIAITTTLAPWFERHQGRAVSTAFLGASVGAIVAAPSLVFAIEKLGFSNAMLAAAAIALTIVLPLAIFVLRHRPQDMGLLPDGATELAPIPPMAARLWTRGELLRHRALQSAAVAFGLGLLVQIGFLTHHVSLTAPTLGAAGAAAVVSATGLSAFVGRVALARFSDRMNVRVFSALVMLLATATLLVLGLVQHPWMLIAASMVYGFTVGNITTLGPIVIRREFGAASFGTAYGMASVVIGVLSGLGPGVFGLLHDAFGSYQPVLLIAAAVELFVAAVIIWGDPARKPQS